MIKWRENKMINYLIYFFRYLYRGGVKKERKLSLFVYLIVWSRKEGEFFLGMVILFIYYEVLFLVLDFDWLD